MSLIQALERIIVDRDFSISAAHALETQIANHPDDSRLADLEEILASYRPGGGEYRFGEEKLENERLLTGKEQSTK